jgi:hypothetical protein
MEVLFLFLSAVGGILMLIGRHKMISDTGGDLPLKWIILLRLVPFSELVYMVGHFAQARRGGIISIVGMWLLVPYFGYLVWNQQSELKGHFANPGQQVEAEMEDDEEWEGEVPAEMAASYAASRVERLTAKSAKVAQVTAKVNEWFTRLQQQRSALGTDPAELTRFNAEAAAYASFNALAKEEVAELQAMQTKSAPKPAR